VQETEWEEEEELLASLVDRLARPKRRRKF
jgi:hypothetical protein